MQNDHDRQRTLLDWTKAIKKAQSEADGTISRSSCQLEQLYRCGSSQYLPQQLLVGEIFSDTADVEKVSSDVGWQRGKKLLQSSFKPEFMDSHWIQYDLNANFS